MVALAAFGIDVFEESLVPEITDVLRVLGAFDMTCVRPEKMLSIEEVALNVDVGAS